jgi:hypothetical protein
MVKRSRKEPRADSRPNGPATLDELFSLKDAFCSAFSTGYPAETLKALQQLGIVVTSSYSGTGAFECAVDGVLDSASKHASTPPPACTYYSASETSEVARIALLSHSELSRPLHVFGDILERLPPDCNFIVLRQVAPTKCSFEVAARLAKSYHQTQPNLAEHCFHERAMNDGLAVTLGISPVAFNFV